MSAAYLHPNVIDGWSKSWACRWINNWHPAKYAVSIYVPGWISELRAAVVDDFGQLVEVQK
jgi:hypothetical protein